MGRVRRRYWLARTRHRERELSRELQQAGDNYELACEIALKFAAVRAMRRQLELNP